MESCLKLNFSESKKAFTWARICFLKKTGDKVRERQKFDNWDLGTLIWTMTSTPASGDLFQDSLSLFLI